MIAGKAGVAEILRLAGIGDAWPWERVAVVNNVAPLVPSRRVEGGYAWNRGFNLVLYGPEGKPEYFCKCRPAHHTPFAREMRIVEALGRVPALEGIVAPTTLGRDERVLVQASRYLPGTPLSLRIPYLSLAEWAVAMGEVLVVAREVVSAAIRGVPDVCRVDEPIVLGVEIEPALAYLAPVVSSPRVVESLRRAAGEAGTVRSYPQHGDLWPGNVLQRERGWSLMDFEQFALVSVPLYDAFHFLRTCWDARPPARHGHSGRPWLDRMEREPEAARLTLDLLWREVGVAQVAVRQVTGLLAFYVADIAHRLHRAGHYYQRVLTEVNWLGEALADGRTPLPDLA